MVCKHIVNPSYAIIEEQCLFFQALKEKRKKKNEYKYKNNMKKKLASVDVTQQYSFKKRHIAYTMQYMAKSTTLVQLTVTDTSLQLYLTVKSKTK